MSAGCGPEPQHRGAAGDGKSAGSTRSLAPLMTPRPVAIIGASERNHHGKAALDNLRNRGFAGPVYLVNPGRREVWGVPCHASVRDTPTVPELGILVLGRERVPEVIRDAAQAGVRAFVINTDGFGESADAEGPALQRELVDHARKAGAIVCGPNCLGIINLHAGVAAYCGPIRQPVRAGNLAFVSQSGGNTASFIELAHARNIGLSHVISTGNEADLDFCDYLEYVIRDEATAAICVLLESIRSPRRFLTLAAEATRAGKPVVALKLGRSAAGQAAALAHTGAFAGSEEATKTLFARAGVLQVYSLDEAIDACALFCLVPRSRWLEGGRMAVITVGGGLAGLFSDIASDRGWTLPPLPEAVQAAIAPDVPQTLRLQNPFDVPGAYLNEHPRIAHNFVRTCSESGAFDAVVILRSMPGAKSLDYLAEIHDLPGRLGKPVFVSSTIDSSMEDYKRAFMERSQLTLLTGFGRMVTGMQAALDFARARRRVQALPIAPAPVRALSASTRARLEREGAGGRRVLSHEATGALLAEFGIPVVPQAVVTTPEEAIAAAARIGYPVVAKIVNSDAATHKTELDAIRTDLATPEALAAAVEALRRIVAEHRLAEDGVPLPLLIQKMVRPAFEIFLGASVPKGGYPPLVLVGAGGIYVELLGDVVRRLAPVGRDEARGMVDELRIARVLDGYRGGLKYDVAAIVEALVNLGELVRAAEDWVSDIDLNPLLVGAEGQGGFVVDAVVTLRERAGDAGNAP